MAMLAEYIPQRRGLEEKGETDFPAGWGRNVIIKRPAKQVFAAIAA